MDRPTVFISSTKDDLEKYRPKAWDAADKAGFFTERMEKFPASGHRPLDECLERVKPCDVLVVIVAHRYGWIPEKQPEPDKKKSITWLECEQAIADGKEVLAFLIDEKYDWPKEFTESYRISKAINDGMVIEKQMKLLQDVNTATEKLKEFKTFLKTYMIASFTDPSSLETAILHALTDWKERHLKPSTKITTSAAVKKTLTIPPDYREWLLQRCGQVDLLASMIKSGTATPRLSSVYVPSPTVPWGKETTKDEKDAIRREEKLFFLLDRFAKESLYVPGLAGSGKSTFSRWVSFLICSGEMPPQVQFNEKEPVLEKFPDALKGKLPLLIPLREFWHSLPRQPGQREMSRKELEQALENWLQQKIEKLDWPTFEPFLKEGRAVLLFDGVDEVPVSMGEGKSIYYPRQMLIAGLKSSVPDWKKAGNRLLLTSRPYSLAENEAQEIGLARSEIIDLPNKLQRLFMTRWFTALNYGREMADDMMAHVAGRDELSELRGNPVMLMAMCVLFPEGKRLPEDKAELYEKTIVRMLFNRYVDKTAEVDKVYHRLSVVAYGMHTGEGLGARRKTPEAQTSYDEIDRFLQNYLDQKDIQEKDFTTVASAREDLLSRSGLLVQKDNRAVSFYHFSFQEFLAGQRFLKLCGDKLAESFQQFAPVREWRPTLAFAFGTILQIDRNPERNMKILRPLLEGASVAEPAPLVLCADFMEILHRKGYVLESNLLRHFKNLCLEAIEKEVPVKDRYDLGRALGLVGDPRLVTDLRNCPERFIKIPAGTYRIGDEKRLYKIERPFWILKYPVTNSQYRIFLEDGGYTEKKWWSPEGWQWREEKKIIEPRLWRHGRWNGENLPVVGVSWYEADAFCRWAGGALPSEWDWEAAARGPRGNIYAWGGDWEDGICNSYQARLNKTSPVGIFPSSRSKDFGLEDMTGNVWEWMKDSTVFRGGSWGYNYSRGFRCAYRLNSNPNDRYDDLGFRVVSSVQPVDLKI